MLAYKSGIWGEIQRDTCGEQNMPRIVKPRGMEVNPEKKIYENKSYILLCIDIIGHKKIWFERNNFFVDPLGTP